MERLVLILVVIFAGCATHVPTPATAPSFISDGSYGEWLEQQIAAIEHSEPTAWRAIRVGADTRGAHPGETFSAACAYLARRDPSLFLRRHLAGDPYGIACGRRAYQWSGDGFRPVLDSIYRFRLLEATSEAEKASIKRFISETTK